MVEEIHSLEEKYNKMYRTGYGKGTNHGLEYIDLITNKLKVKNILDVGCGRGYAVKEFIKRGYDCKGIEISSWLFENDLRELKEQDLVFHTSSKELPFEDNSFNLIFCTDVIEHIPEQDIISSINEMVRVSNKYLFFTIAKSKSDYELNGFNPHLTIKPREWWIKIIEIEGNTKLISPNWFINFLLIREPRLSKFKFFRKRGYYLFKKNFTTVSL